MIIRILNIIRFCFLNAVVFLCININVYAEDFFAINKGDTIFYNITSNAHPYTVEVSFKGKKYDLFNQYKGSISIPQDVTYNNIKYIVVAIGESAFRDCFMLEEVSLPQTIKSINQSAFDACNSLKSISIPNSVTNISSYAFYSCRSLKNVKLSNSISIIGISVFEDCSSLSSIEIPNSVVSIENSAFRGCVSLEKIVFPKSVVSIRESAFRNCIKLSSVHLSNSIISIGNNAFRNCESLYSISFPNNITHIGLFAFENCKSINSISCQSQKPPRIYSTTFYGVDTNIPVKVPCGSNSLYNKAIYWTEFSNININDTTIIKEEICQGKTYNLNGFNASNEGNHIKKLNTKNGCDSIILLNLQINPNSITNLLCEICEGETYDYFGFNLNKPGLYSQRHKTIKGCDSIINLELIINKPQKTLFEAEVCENETYNENGFKTNQQGIYTQELKTHKGCDSIVELRLRIIPNLIPKNLTLNLLPQNIELSWKGNGKSYDIFRNGGYVATVKEPYFKENYIPNNKTYCYKVKSSNQNCKSQFSYVDCRCCVAENSSLEDECSIQLHYKSQVGKIELEFAEIERKTEIFVYDNFAKLLNKYTLFPSHNKISLDVSKFIFGIYHINIQDIFHSQSIYFLFDPVEGIKEIDDIQ
ncbi:MAG: leucine-rich repeat domain-containing protein [Bacteroidales bacterium]|nr:leucine-rich repeat domain-containing protein [Bacteroidales bacterium]MDD4830348.1 leucine-rich repeat domain-containing protein [Bacteroidales bacterium]